MRTILLTFTLCAIAYSADEQQIITAEKGWAAAVDANDFARMHAMLTPDLIYAQSTGIIDHKTQDLEKMRTGKQNYAGTEHTSTTVPFHGDAAVAHSQIRVHGTHASGPFNDQLMMMHVWVKSKGKWLLAAHQT